MPLEGDQPLSSIAMADGWSSKVVFRLRKLPSHISDLSDAQTLLSDAFSIPADHITVFSLAEDTSDRWEDPPPKVATIQLKSPPPCLGAAIKSTDNSEWPIRVPGGEPNDVMILDSHFRGMTVLCSPRPDKHHTE